MSLRHAINGIATLTPITTALLAHGIAHLLGHDHITDADYEKMKPIEQHLITAAQDKKL